MNQDSFNSIVAIIAKYLFAEFNELCKFNLAQVHNLMNVLINANIPFSVEFNQGTNSQAKCLVITITLSPTSEMSKTFQLEEGAI